MYFIPFFINCFLLFNYNQTIEVTYLESKRYSAEEYISKFVKSNNPSVLNQIRSTYDKVKTEHLLVIEGQQSFYFSPDFIDSARGNTQLIRTKSGKKHRYTNLSAQNIYFKDYSTDQFKAKLFSRTGEYNIDDNLLKFNWKLTKDKKMILGYQCQKAIISEYKGFDVEAWYTAEIPVSNGPNEYGGLPGLILELNFAALKFRAQEIYFNKNRCPEMDIMALLPLDNYVNWSEYLNSTMRN